mgnify:CR=1 FL=1
MNRKGKVVIFSAPSGAGKTTVVRHLLSQNFKLEFSVSATTRELRGKEKDTVDYYFFSVEEFKERINNNEFIEWEEVYKDRYYGTLKSEVERIWEKGNNVIFDVDVKGGINLKKIFGSDSISVFVMPPSIEELKKRLINRKTDSAEEIEKRISKASYEIGFSSQFDVVLINDDLNKTLKEAERIIGDFLLK